MKEFDIIVIGSPADNDAAAAELAAQLQLPLCPSDDPRVQTVPYFLRFESGGLTLHRNHGASGATLRADFYDDTLQRRSADNLRQQNLCKAVGLKAKRSLSVLDAMAGLGKDAWLLASAGARVDMLERNPVVFALLRDACERELRYANARELRSGAGREAPIARMQWRLDEFPACADTLPEFDVVYLDPMFPPTQKQAKAKKDMQLLQELLPAGDSDDEAILAAARRLARNRVVVKRAKLSPYLAGQQPDTQFKGSSNRYDVYFCGGSVTGE